MSGVICLCLKTDDFHILLVLKKLQWNSSLLQNIWIVQKVLKLKSKSNSLPILSLPPLPLFSQQNGLPGF